MRLFTSRYQNQQIIAASGLVAIGITVGRPRFRLDYQLAGIIRELAPSGDLFAIDERAVFAPIYEARLERLGVTGIRSLVRSLSGGAAAVLLCFEDVTSHEGSVWCHRQVFAAWWERQTGEIVLELPADRPILSRGSRQRRG
jgi:hypothetical protein